MAIMIPSVISPEVKSNSSGLRLRQEQTTGSFCIHLELQLITG